MGKVIEISEIQAKELKGKSFAPRTYFNPIQDANGVWVISEEEATQVKLEDTDIAYVKDLVKRTHEKKEFNEQELAELIVEYVKKFEEKTGDGEVIGDITPTDETIKP